MMEKLRQEGYNAVTYSFGPGEYCLHMLDVTLTKHCGASQHLLSGQRLSEPYV